MTPKQFIEKAIKGGYRGKNIYQDIQCKWHFNQEFCETCVLFDPLAWQAVGKVEGWDDGGTIDERYAFVPENRWMWEHKMYRMIDALVEGKTIEQFLETL